MNNIMSLPSDFVVPVAWTKTPDRDQVSPVAQSSFANWKDERLTTLSTGLTIGKVVSVMGIGTSLFLASIPGVILCGAALVICFIGASVIRREQIARCQKTCLQFENWCIQFRNLAEELTKIIEPYVRNNCLQIDLGDIQNLLNVVNELPDNNVEDFKDNLSKQHYDLFGHVRRIGRGYNTWINVDFYLFGDEKSFMQGRCDETWINDLHPFRLCTDLAYRICSSFQKLASNEGLIGDADFPNRMNAQKLTATVRQMYSLFHPTPIRGVTGTLVDQAEQWRQNIAAFRSSLS